MYTNNVILSYFPNSSYQETEWQTSLRRSLYILETRQFVKHFSQHKIWHMLSFIAFSFDPQNLVEWITFTANTQEEWFVAV